MLNLRHVFMSSPKSFAIIPPHRFDEDVVPSWVVREEMISQLSA